MSRADSPHAEMEALRAQLAEAKQTIDALTAAEVDAIMREGSPLLLHAAQEQLRRSEGLLRAVFDNTREAIVLVDGDGVCIEANNAASALFGVPREALLGRRPRDMRAPPFDEEAAWQRFVAAGVQHGDFPVLRPDGSVRDTEYSAVSNVLPGVHLSVLRDVTERRREQAALFNSERRFRALTERSTDVVAVAGPDGVLSYVSPSVAEVLGIEPESMRGQSAFDFVHPDDLAQAAASLHALLDRPQETVSSSLRLRRSDGSFRHLEFTARNLLAEPSVQGLVTNFRDVTERLATEDALRFSEQRYRRIVESVAEGIIQVDADGRIVFLSGRMAQILGDSVEHCVGKNVFDYFDEDERQKVRDHLRRRRDGIGAQYELTYRRRDGTLVPTWVQATPLRDERGTFDGSLGVVTDLTEQHRADEVSARLQAIVESSEDAIIGFNRQRKITAWNRGAEKLFQYAAHEALGADVLMLQDENTSDRGALFMRLLAGETIPAFETKRRRKDGSTVEVLLGLSPLFDATGRVIGGKGVARDLTHHNKREASLRTAEEQLRQMQKMDAIGSLAGGIAHDFNNLLSVILSYCSLLIGDLAPDDPIVGDLTEVEKAALQAADLTRQLLAFSRQQVLEPKVLDLNRVVGNVEKLMRRLVGEDVQIVFEPGAALQPVLADWGQLEQVIMNLVANARDAMPGGGVVTIETGNVDVTPSHPATLSGAATGPHVLLSVTDTGTGMSDETKARIFEPFFTTKAKGKGTGLGLATVFGIVRQSGGSIVVDTAPQRGTSMRIFLPATTAVPVQSAPAEAPIEHSRGAGEVILVVDDDDKVRAVACAALRRGGYTVLEAANAGEAILLSEERAEAIDLLLTDVVMPRVDGGTLSQKLREQRPDIKVLFMSGYTDDAIVHRGVRTGDASFLQKPITPGPLLRKVRQVLAKHTDGAAAATIDTLQTRYLAAVLAGRRSEALGVIDDGIARGESATELSCGVIGRAQAAVGELWQHGRLAIVDEHRATAISESALTRLVQRSRPAAANGKRAVVACVDGERHALPAKLAADALVLAGFDVWFLGANVATTELPSLVRAAEPHLVCLSATMPSHLQALTDAVAAVRAAMPTSVIGVGGAACAAQNGVVELVGADFTANDARALVVEARSRLQAGSAAGA